MIGKYWTLTEKEQKLYEKCKYIDEEKEGSSSVKRAIRNTRDELYLEKLHLFLHLE